MPWVIVAWKGSCRDGKIRNRLLGHLHRLAMQSDGFLRSGEPQRPTFLNLVNEQRGAGLRSRANIETIDRAIPGPVLVSSDISPSLDALVESAREAGLAVIEREAPGIPHALREASRPHTHHWMLSRAQAGTRGASLIVNFPGSPASIEQAGEALAPALGHALALIAGRLGGH